MAELAFRGPFTTSQRLNLRIAEEALRRGHGVAYHRPVEVYLQVASACNLDCYMCSEHLRPPEWRHGRGLVSLSQELYDRIVAEVFPYSSRLTIGLGGEPMISPDFLHYVERAYEAKQEIVLTTNGTRINRDREAEVLARCVSNIQISIDGATKETYERIRVGSHWSKIRANLALLNRYRMRLPPEERARVTFYFVLMRSNVHELPAMIRMAHEFHADHLHAQHVIPVTEESQGERLSLEPELYNRYLPEALREARRLGISVDLPQAYPAGERAPEPSPGGRPLAPPDAENASSVRARAAPAGGRIPCRLPTITVYIFYDGRVFPCCHPYAHQKMPMGDLRTQSFAEIWNGVRYRNLRAGLFRGDAPSICRGCSIANDPPPEDDDPDANGGESAGIDAFYAGRELAPIPEGVRPQDFEEILVRTGLADQFETLRTRANASASKRVYWKLRQAVRRSSFMPVYRRAQRLLGRPRDLPPGRK